MRNVHQGMSLIFKVSSSVNNINTNKSMPRYIKDKFKKFKANRVKKKKIERLTTKVTIILNTDFSSTTIKNKDNRVTLSTC